MIIDNEQLPEGYQQTEVRIIPEDWSVKSLGEICIKIQDGNYGGDYPKSHEFLSYGIPFLTSKVLGKDGSLKEDRIDFISHDKHARLDKAHLQLNDVLFTNRGASVGAIGFVNEKISNGNIGPQLTLLRADEKVILSIFLYYIMRSATVTKQISGQDSGSAMNFFSIGATEKFKIPFPLNREEQRSIAQALSDVDALIAALDKAIAKKRHLKTATMQQLLTGKKRLPGFGEGKGYQKTEIGTIPEDWNVKHLKDALKTNPRYGINAAAVPYRDSLPIYIRITDISEAGYFAPESLVSVNQENSDQYYLEEGDLVFARTGASVGKSYLYNPNDGKLVFAGFLIRIRPNENILLPDYLSQYVRTKAYWDWVQLMSMRSGQPGINGNEYGQLLVPFPDMKEQRAIATVLSDMDAEIAALETRRAKTQALKQGMMQQLLTGKVRLKIEV